MIFFVQRGLLAVVRVQQSRHHPRLLRVRLEPEQTIVTCKLVAKVSISSTSFTATASLS